jgi:hypothetical protein
MSTARKPVGESLDMAFHATDKRVVEIGDLQDPQRSVHALAALLTWEKAGRLAIAPRVCTPNQVTPTPRIPSVGIRSHAPAMLTTNIPILSAAE